MSNPENSLAGTEAANGRLCADCGTEVAPALLTCPACRRLVHAEELKRLADEAARATAANDLAGALTCWRDALALLPVDSRQATVVSEKVAALSAQVDAAGGVGSEASARHGAAPAWLKRAGPVGGVALLAWKFKFIVAFVATKGKLFFLGLTNIGTLASMAISLGVYGAVWGWKFAAGLIASIYVHEMGHVAALRRFGMQATAPMFIPGVGALIRSKHNPVGPVEDARVGLAGPLWGLGAALAAYIVFLATHAVFWAAIARAGAWINLFNLLPVWPLDGGRGYRALARKQRWLLAGAFGLLWLATKDGLLILLAIVAVVRAAGRAQPDAGDRLAFAEYLILAAGLSALAALPVPLFPN